MFAGEGFGEVLFECTACCFTSYLGILAIGSSHLIAGYGLVRRMCIWRGLVSGETSPTVEGPAYTEIPFLVLVLQIRFHRVPCHQRIESEGTRKTFIYFVFVGSLLSVPCKTLVHTGQVYQVSMASSTLKASAAVEYARIRI